MVFLLKRLQAQLEYPMQGLPPSAGDTPTGRLEIWNHEIAAWLPHSLPRYDSLRTRSCSSRSGTSSQCLLMPLLKSDPLNQGWMQQVGDCQPIRRVRIASASLVALVELVLHGVVLEYRKLKWHKVS